MSKTKNILIGTCGIGIATMFCIIVAVAHIISEMQMIENELNAEIQAFKLKASDLWRDMMSMNVSYRQRRQYPTGSQVTGEVSKETEALTDGYDDGSSRLSDSYGREAPSKNKEARRENANRENLCPAGPPGPKGPKGVDGMDGMDGMDAPDGPDTNDVRGQLQQYESCFHCPPGPVGQPGPPGRPGPRGMRGSRGRNGADGHDGQPGLPGLGEQGDPGEEGMPGSDAEYCQCPSRSRSVNNQPSRVDKVSGGY
uniref:Col_cuticle_N domain-containing protein n=1 Tax=Elaeophora elaphi TaxID=1147741 RepID=A0A0R3RZ74_9BILA